jgi:hypothetical protein
MCPDLKLFLIQIRFRPKLTDSFGFGSKTLVSLHKNDLAPDPDSTTFVQNIFIPQLTTLVSPDHWRLQSPEPGGECGETSRRLQIQHGPGSATVAASHS